MDYSTALGGSFLNIPMNKREEVKRLLTDYEVFYTAGELFDMYMSGNTNLKEVLKAHRKMDGNTSYVELTDNLKKILKEERIGGIQKYSNTLMEDAMPGGKADGLTAQKIAERHGVSVEYINRQLDIGTEIEMEHTDDHVIARNIAADHLFEFQDYYIRLKKMEKQAKADSEEQ